jgi:hypothetical protein
MSQIKLTEQELKRIQDLNMDFNNAKMKIADNVLMQQNALKALEDLRTTFGVEERKLAEIYGQDAIINLETGEVSKKEPELVEAEEVK